MYELFSQIPSEKEYFVKTKSIILSVVVTMGRDIEIKRQETQRPEIVFIDLPVQIEYITNDNVQSQSIQ